MAQTGAGPGGSAATENRTIGTSPKAIAATIAAFVAPLVVRLIAELFDISIEQDAIEGLILAAVAAVSAFAAARAAKPGNVQRVPKDRA